MSALAKEECWEDGVRWLFQSEMGWGVIFKQYTIIPLIREETKSGKSGAGEGEGEAVGGRVRSTVVQCFNCDVLWNKLPNCGSFETS